MVNKFEVIEDIPSIIRRIQNLKEEGVREDEIYVYAKTNLSSEFGSNYKVHIHKAKGNVFQKFTSAFTKHSAEEKITDKMHLTEEEADYYHQAIEDGKLVMQVEQSAKYDAVTEKPIEEVGTEDDDSVHIDLNKREDY